MDENIEESDLPPIIRELASMKPDELIFEEGLASIFRRHPTSIKRAVERGEIPPPVRLFGKCVWNVKCLLSHIDFRLARANAESIREQKRVESTKR